MSVDVITLGPIGLASSNPYIGDPAVVTPSYVTGARSALGPDRLLAVLLMVIPVTDRETARRAPIKWCRASSASTTCPPGVRDWLTR